MGRGVVVLGWGLGTPSTPRCMGRGFGVTELYWGGGGTGRYWDVLVAIGMHWEVLGAAGMC